MAGTGASPALRTPAISELPLLPRRQVRTCDRLPPSLAALQIGPWVILHPMLQHVTRALPRAHLGPCTTFYGLLGFERVPVPATVAGAVVWLECRGTQIHLTVDEAAVPEAGHIAVVASDYVSTLRRLRDGGYAVEPRQEHWGSPRAFVQDPFGNLVEVMAFGPGQSTSPATMHP